jgi:hypothetical protein
VDGFPEVLAELKEKLTETKADALRKFPQVLFLGTGSCIPNKTRNTSGILVHTRYGTRQTHTGAGSLLLRLEFSLRLVHAEFMLIKCQ